MQEGDYGNNKNTNRRQIARAVLTRARVHDPLARGLAVGASAHGLGTASLVLAVRVPREYPLSTPVSTR